MAAPIQGPFRTFLVAGQNIPVVPTPTPGNIIIHQSQINQLPSVTYANLPSAHYLLHLSQANPIDFQIVSDLAPSFDINLLIGNT